MATIIIKDMITMITSIIHYHETLSNVSLGRSVHHLVPSDMLLSLVYVDGFTLRLTCKHIKRSPRLEFTVWLRNPILVLTRFL